jgi:hypothetical protein
MALRSFNDTHLLLLNKIKINILFSHFNYIIKRPKYLYKNNKNLAIIIEVSGALWCLYKYKK